MSKSKVYIAGPMRGLVNDNRDHFFAVASCLRDLGYTVFNPAEHDIENNIPAGVTDGKQLKAQILWDLERIAESDLVVLLPNWINSTGVRLELEMARFIGVPVKSFAEVVNFHHEFK